MAKKTGLSSSLGAAANAFKATWNGANTVYEKGKEALYVAVPLTALAVAYMASRILSPGGVKSNIPDMVIANTEHANLVQSIRELERLEHAKSLKNKSKVHDQFI